MKTKLTTHKNMQRKGTELAFFSIGGVVRDDGSVALWIQDDDMRPLQRNDIKDICSLLMGLAVSKPFGDAVYCFAELSADGELSKLSLLNSDELTALQEAP